MCCEDQTFDFKSKWAPRHPFNTWLYIYWIGFSLFNIRACVKIWWSFTSSLCRNIENFTNFSAPLYNKLHLVCIPFLAFFQCHHPFTLSSWLSSWQLPIVPTSEYIGWLVHYATSTFLYGLTWHQGPVCNTAVCYKESSACQGKTT